MLFYSWERRCRLLFEVNHKNNFNSRQRINERFNDFDRIKKNKKICNYSLFFKIYFCEFLCISFSNNQFKFLYHSNLIKFFLQLLQIISYITIDIYAIYIPIFLCN